MILPDKLNILYCIYINYQFKYIFILLSKYNYDYALVVYFH